MPKQRNSPMILRILGIGIALIQLFDIIIHVVTNQIKPLRVSSNLIVLRRLAVVASGKNIIGMLHQGYPLAAGHNRHFPELVAGASAPAGA